MNEFAVVHEINPGPTVGFAYAVHLQTIEDAAAGRRGLEMWNSYEIEPARVLWAGPDTLEVVVDSNYSYRWSVHEHGKHGIRVRTVWIEPGGSSVSPPP